MHFLYNLIHAFRQEIQANSFGRSRVSSQIILRSPCDAKYSLIFIISPSDIEAGMMKILLMGAYGMLGHKLMQRMKRDYDIYGTCREIRHGAPWSSVIDDDRLIAGVRAEKIETVALVLSESKPDVVNLHRNRETGRGSY